MVEKAIAKIKAEITKKVNDPYVNVIGSFLIRYIQNNPEEAEKIMALDKSIEKSMAEMRRAAEKKKVGNCAVLTDEEGFDIVLKYFGLRGGAAGSISTESARVGVDRIPPAYPKMPEKSFSIDLDELLV